MLLEAQELSEKGKTVLIDTYYDKLLYYYIDKYCMRWLISPSDRYFSVMKQIAEIDKDILPDADIAVFFEINYDDWLELLKVRDRSTDHDEAFMKNFETQKFLLEATKKLCEEKGIEEANYTFGKWPSGKAPGLGPGDHFKNWLEKNIIEQEEEVVKLRLEKQIIYTNLTSNALNRFMDSLEATLDNDDTCHLFPDYFPHKSFENLFNPSACYFGKKTNKKRIDKLAIENKDLQEKIANHKKEKGELVIQKCNEVSILEDEINDLRAEINQLKFSLSTKNEEIAACLLSKVNGVKGFSINHNAGTNNATEPHTHFHIVPSYEDGHKDYHFFGDKSLIYNNFDDIFDSWKNYFDDIQKLTKSIKNFNLFARVGKVDGGKTRSKRRQLSEIEMGKIAQELKKGSVPNPNNPPNPNDSKGGEKNANGIADAKFLQDVAKLTNYSDDLGEYASFNKKILDLYHNKKFTEIEIYQRFESDNTLLKTQVDELKKILVIKNDEPTDNSNKNNDTSDPKKDSPPNDNQPNPNKPDSSPLELPTIDTKKITNAENIETAQLSAKQQIKALFSKRLTTNQAIVAFSQLLERKIKEKQQAIKNKNNINSSAKPNSVNKALLFSLGGGAILLVFIDEFGRNYTTVYEVAENWDSDNFNHHREEGKYINNDKGTEITYPLRRRPNPKKIENGFDDGFFLPGNFKSDEELKHQERLNGSRLQTLERDKKEFEEKLTHYESLPAEERRNEDTRRMGRDEVGKLITNKEDNNSDLRKENQELRQQLTAVQKQLAEVLEELKKLKNNINGKGNEKLEQQIVQNERLIKDSENLSVAEVQEQVNKSQALMKEFNNVSATEDNKAGNGSFPYVVGGSVILVSAGIIGYFLLQKNRGKKSA
ncbi:7397_t:CDS:10 [Entrophospora sp. SA101]|nr:7397_t:CDS:10 [Entrophospora sp. SA101]